MGNDTRGSPSSSASRDTRRTRSLTPSNTRGPGGNHDIEAQDTALVAQLTARAGMSSHDISHTIPYGSLLAPGGYLASSGFNNHLLNHGDIAHNQLLPFSSLDLPWHLFLPQHQGHQTDPDQFSQIQRNASAASSSSHPHDGTSLLARNVNSPESPGCPSRRSSINATAFASASAPASTSEPNSTEPERAAVNEEKRRRNTEASARFRIKKKQKTNNLERTVSDLKGRTEDLEREAADLRRENGWLKEIVILKGSRLTVANLASHIMAESAQRTAEQNSSKRENEVSDGDSSDTEEASMSKRKGKSPKK